MSDSKVRMGQRLSVLLAARCKALAFLVPYLSIEWEETDQKDKTELVNFIPYPPLTSLMF